MLRTRNVAKAQNCRVGFFSTKQLHLLILCTFSRFGESGFSESGLNLFLQRMDMCILGASGIIVQVM